MKKGPRGAPAADLAPISHKLTPKDANDIQKKITKIICGKTRYNLRTNFINFGKKFVLKR